ncbi:hypothetical protein D3C78_1242740 [compost metagenome]
MHVGQQGQFRLRVAGNRHQLGAHAPGHGQDGQQFLARARIRHGNHHVILRDHAQVAMHGFRGVYEESGRAGRGERRGDLAGDVPGLADAGDHDAAPAGQQHRDDLGE